MWLVGLPGGPIVFLVGMQIKLYFALCFKCYFSHGEREGEREGDSSCATTI